MQNKKSGKEMICFRSNSLSFLVLPTIYHSPILFSTKLQCLDWFLKCHFDIFSFCFKNIFWQYGLNHIIGPPVPTCELQPKLHCLRRWYLSRGLATFLIRSFLRIGFVLCATLSWCTIYPEIPWFTHVPMCIDCLVPKWPWLNAHIKGWLETYHFHHIKEFWRVTKIDVC